MPSTRTSERRLANKRTILSALDENSSLDDPTFHHTKFHSNGHQYNSSSPSSFPIPDLDYTQLKNIELLLTDLEREIDSRKESLDIQKVNMLKRQQEVYFVNMVKIAKSIKKMTIRDFNAAHNTNIVNVMKKSMIGDNASAVVAMGAKKRVRSNGTSNNNSSSSSNSSRLPMETPVRQIATGGIRTPGTILRTVRKGETVYSINGSPVDMAEEGDLVATVCKKRRGNGSDGHGAIFDINVGDGRYISLSDANAIRDLPEEMKIEAKNQLNVLQDQLSKLMAHLKN